MMKSTPAPVRFSPLSAATAAIAVILLALSGSLARAEDAGAASSAATSPVEEFSQQLEDFQKSVPDLNKSIQDSAGTIDSATDVAEGARRDRQVA